jgi:hypothetical protein
MTTGGREERDFFFEDDDDVGVFSKGEVGNAADVGVGTVPVEVVYSDRVSDGGRALSSTDCFLPGLLPLGVTEVVGEGYTGMATFGSD